MIVAFRVDASLLMGSGHLMRCLTLADALQAQGARCHFLSREHVGHLHAMVGQRGHQLHVLPVVDDGKHAAAAGTALAHAAWLGCAQATDAGQCAALLQGLQPDWLVVDHYALDQHWEHRQCHPGRQLLVIDDLADRQHQCDLLLDQNLGRSPGDYAALVPAACQVLIGPAYALLRPEFAAQRELSLTRRRQPHLHQLLVTLGGADHANATGAVLNALRECMLPADSRITVVMGAQSQSLPQVRELAASLRWPVEVQLNVSDMATLMTDSDLALGAAGSTAWERCCLGLPALQLVLAANQQSAAQALADAHAALPLSLGADLPVQLAAHLQLLQRDPGLLGRMSKAAAAITDGMGCTRVCNAMQNGQV